MIAHTHLILTRFSVRGSLDQPPASAAWLEYRLGLFRDYCVPSVAAQTCRDFRWLVLCDVSTPAATVAEIEAMAGSELPLEVVMTSPERGVIDEVATRTRSHDRLLITTRIDSDDAIPIDFVQRVQTYADPFVAHGRRAMLLNFACGYKLLDEQRELHETWNPHSPFLSLFERLGPGAQVATVQSGNHGYMQQRYPVHVDVTPAMWLEVVHGGNVSNKVYAIEPEVPLSRIADRFRIRARTRRGEVVPADQPATERERAVFRQDLEDALLGSASGPGGGAALSAQFR